MSLNIKNDDTHRMARELAQLTGENVTKAVSVAIRERLEREKQSRAKQCRLEWLLQLSAKTAPIMNRTSQGKASNEMIDDLYDPETGLPV